MLKDDLQACWVSGYSFIGCSKFDQVDGYFGPGATKCHYRGVAEIAFAQGACIFAETFTKGLHKGIVHLHRLPQGACTGSNKGWHLCTDFHKGLAHLHKRLQPGEATERHLRWVKTLSWQYFKARMGFTAQLASAPMRLRGWAGHYCNGVIITKMFQKKF